MQAQLNRLTDEALQKKALEKIGLAVEREAKIKVPSHTGELANSIASRVEGLTAIIGTNLEYAVYVHQGTGIYAVNGDGRQDAWTWYDVSGDYTFDGQPGFVTTIGQAPHPFLTDALHAVQPLIPQIEEEIIKEALK